jgi:predicted PurR-regulated permease PerM
VLNPYGPAQWSRSLVIAVDVVVVVWLAAMLVVGGLIKFEVDQLAATADSMTEVATQENDLASALGPLRSLPLAGDQLAAVQVQLQQSAMRTEHDAAVARTSVHALGTSAFLLVVLLAVFPVFVFYIPMRLTRHARTPAAHRRRRAPA